MMCQPVRLFSLLILHVLLVGTTSMPIVLVPGLGSSQIEARVKAGTTPAVQCDHVLWPGHSDHEWHRLWINFGYFIPGWTECFMHRMNLTFDAKTGEVYSAGNISTRVVGWGNTSTINLLDPDLVTPWLREQGAVFNPLSQYFISALGYIAGVNLAGAPYDWRFAPSSPSGQDMLDNLKNLVEKLYSQQGGKVMLVSHSMGGNYVLRLLRTVEQSWKDKFIAGWISVSSVFAGSLATVVGAAAGWNEQILTIDNNEFSYVQRNWESSWWLNPRRNIYGADTLIATSPGRNFTLADVRDIFVKRGFADGFDFFTKRVEYLEDDFSPVGVPMHCFFSTGVPTMSRMDWKNDHLLGHPELVRTSNGDGSVSDVSLQMCRKMQPASVHFYHGIEHLAMIHTLEVIKDIASIILTAKTNQEGADVIV